MRVLVKRRLRRRARWCAAWYISGLRFPHLMELQSFFGPLTMERKAPFADCGGKLFQKCIRQCFFFLLYNGIYMEVLPKLHQTTRWICKCGSCITCFAGIPDSGLCPASEPIESGRGADVQKPWFQMFADAKFSSSTQMTSFISFQASSC